jgi:hypothetical protein
MNVLSPAVKQQGADMAIMASMKVVDFRVPKPQQPVVPVLLLVTKTLSTSTV